MAGWGFVEVEVGSMRTWKVIFVPFWRIGDRAGWVGGVDVDWEGVGWERIVTRGTKEFQLGQVEVSVRADQTFGEGAVMKVELPMCMVACSGVMLGVARVALVGSLRGGMVGLDLGLDIRWFGLGRRTELER